MHLTTQARQQLETALSKHGLRSTRQREQVYAMIFDNKNHPTADDIYALARKELPGLSLATVYNCLETLVECNLIKEIEVGRPPVRYEPNCGEHAHFYCKASGSVFDIDLDDSTLNAIKKILPKGFQAESVHLRFQGTTKASSA